MIKIRGRGRTRRARKNTDAATFQQFVYMFTLFNNWVDKLLDKVPVERIAGG